MAGMKVKVTMDHKKVKKLSDTQLKAVAMTAEQMLHEVITDAVIPFDEGTLQNVQTYVDRSELKNGNVSIVHDTPYARRLYYNPQYDFDTTINANARGEWWGDWLEGGKQSRPQYLFRQFYRYLNGGMIK